MPDVVICEAVRTPIGRFQGGLSSVRPDDLLAHVFRAVIERTGRITQYVGFDARAWHAGASCLAGRERVNDFAVGIELEGTDDCAYSPWQYRALVWLIGVLQARYPAITAERIVGHADIAPGRKTDPGRAFDWAGLHGAMARR